VSDFQLIMENELPTYMENVVGLMIKKLFYNLKKFIDKSGQNSNAHQIPTNNTDQGGKDLPYPGYLPN